MKNKYITSRFFAYITDFFTVSIISSLIIVSDFSAMANEVLLALSEQGFEYTQEFENLIGNMYYEAGNDALFTLLIFIIYYVTLPKMMGSRTLGCILFKQKIVKTDGTDITHSDLTVKMLFTNGGIVYLLMSLIFIPFSSYVLPSILVYCFASITYYIFFITNAAYLVAKGTSLVDKMSKTKPMVIIKAK